MLSLFGLESGQMESEPHERTSLKANSPSRQHGGLKCLTTLFELFPFYRCWTFSGRPKGVLPQALSWGGTGQRTSAEAEQTTNRQLLVKPSRLSGCSGTCCVSATSFSVTAICGISFIPPAGMWLTSQIKELSFFRDWCGLQMFIWTHGLLSNTDTIFIIWDTVTGLLRSLISLQWKATEQLHSGEPWLVDCWVPSAACQTDPSCWWPADISTQNNQEIRLKMSHKAALTMLL